MRWLWLEKWVGIGRFGFWISTPKFCLGKDEQGTLLKSELLVELDLVSEQIDGVHYRWCEKPVVTA